MKITFDFNSCFDKFYPYRTAMVSASLWIRLDEQGKKQIARYIDRMGYKMDNHISWRLKDGTCFTYSDGALGIGPSLIVGRW